jgi:predicted dehydrogenase
MMLQVSHRRFAMIRVGIVGSDNSHALAFSQLMNTEKGKGDPRWEEAHCVALYGTDPVRNAEVAEKGKIPMVVPTVEEMLKHVDAAMVVWRHGDLHASHALPFLQAGKPVFVDKPFAIKVEDCQAMLDAANKSRALLTSYSTTRWTKAIRKLQGGPLTGVRRAADGPGVRSRGPGERVRRRLLLRQPCR